jgi:hypothetical protein
MVRGISMGVYRMTTEKLDRMIQQVIPHARKAYLAIAEKGARTPVARVEFGKKDGKPIFSVFGEDFSEGFNGNGANLAHEVDGVGATQPGFFPVILDFGTDQDTRVIRVALGDSGQN